MSLFNKKGHLACGFNTLLSDVSKVLCPHGQDLEGSRQRLLSKCEPASQVPGISVLGLGKFQCRESELSPDSSSVNVFPFLSGSTILRPQISEESIRGGLEVLHVCNRYMRPPLENASLAH